MLVLAFPHHSAGDGRRIAFPEFACPAHERPLFPTAATVTLANCYGRGLAHTMLDFFTIARNPPRQEAGRHWRTTLDPDKSTRIKIGKLAVISAVVQASIPHIAQHVDAIFIHIRHRDLTLVSLTIVSATVVTGLSAVVLTRFPAAVFKRKTRMSNLVMHEGHRKQRDSKHAAMVIILCPSDLDLFAATPGDGRAFIGVVHVLRREDLRACIHAFDVAAAAGRVAGVVCKRMSEPIMSTSGTENGGC